MIIVHACMRTQLSYILWHGSCTNIKINCMHAWLFLLQNFSGIPAAQGSVFFPHFIISLLGIPTIVLGVVHALSMSGSVAKIIGTIVSVIIIRPI